VANVFVVPAVLNGLEGDEIDNITIINGRQRGGETAIIRSEIVRRTMVVDCVIWVSNVGNETN
jgi:hypothetical protein